MANIREEELLLWDFLKRAGYSNSRIDTMCPETRLLQDLRLAGDNLLDTLELLRDQFGVDFSDFDWSKYTPSEAQYRFNVLGRLIGAQKKLESFEPITLSMVARALHLKRWT